MNDNYYQQKFFLPAVTKQDTVIGPVERWQAHQKGILHRGFTLILTYRHFLVWQLRKHPAFDRFWDLTFSSHPTYQKEKLETDWFAIKKSLKREWGIEAKNLLDKPQKLGKFYYQANDPKSVYQEHEFDYLYFAQIKKKPQPNPFFSHDFALIPSERLTNLNLTPLAPWVKIILKKFTPTIIKLTKSSKTG